MKRGILSLGLLAAVGAVLVGASLAVAGPSSSTGVALGATLTGYGEVPAISTTGRATLQANLDGTTLSFKLHYEGLEGGSAGAAHIHLGQTDVNGGVIAFFCGGGGKPACPTGPSGDVEGTIVPTDVIGPAGQGIAAGQFDELVAALRAGVVYANLHTPTYPTGEIRGQVRALGHG